MFNNELFRFEILNDHDSDLVRWRNLLKKVVDKDVYSSPEYMGLFRNSRDEESENFGGEPKLAFFGNDEFFLLYPFFKRQICKLDFCKGLAFNCDCFYDIVSPWYYGGMLYHTTDKRKEDLILLTNEFRGRFNSYCQENNIVSEFMRLHPFINHDILVQCLGMNSKKLKDIVCINLNSDVSEIVENFKKSKRKGIAKSRRNNVRVFLSSDAYYINEFHRLYTNNMDKLKANKKYYFSKFFLDKLFEVLYDNSTLFVAEYDGKVIASSLFIFKHGFVHCYLSASDPNFNRLHPISLIIYEATIWAKENGNKILELGGGYKLNDSLYKFKSSFSKDTVELYAYTKIHNEHIYKMLCDAREEYGRIKSHSESALCDYFPVYRKGFEYKEDTTSNIDFI